MIESIEQEIRTLRSIFWSGRDPEGRAFVPLADAYRRAGDFRQAVELLREGLERHPSFTSAHIVAAQVYHERGLGAEAELALRQVLDLDPGNVVALSLLAESLDERGEVVKARELRALHDGLVGVADEPVAEVAELAPEPVVDVEAPAPDEPTAADEAVDVATLAPDEPVVDVAELAPDEPVVDVEALAPDEPVVDVAALAPEPVVDVAELAPDEPVVDVAALAPDQPITDEGVSAPDDEAAAAFELVPDAAELAAELKPESVVDVADLAPDPQPEPVMDEDAPAPGDEVAAAFEPVSDASDSAAAFEPILDPTAWASLSAPEPFEPVAEAQDVAPEPGIEPMADPSGWIDSAAEADGETFGDLPGRAAPSSELEPASEFIGDEDEIDEATMVTRTMAELFASQGLVDQALDVFRQLLEVTPGDAGLRQRVAELSAHLGDPEASAPDTETERLESVSTGGAALPEGGGALEDDDLTGHAWDADAQADHHEVDTPFAWTHQDPAEESPAGPPISAYFSRMLAWRPAAPEAQPDSVGGDEPADAPDREDA